MLLGIGTVTSNQINWNRMFYSSLKIPYGTYVMKRTLPDLFEEVRRNRNSIQELTDTLYTPMNFLSVSNTFTPTELEVESIMFETEFGSNFIIGANFFRKSFLDTLNLDIDTSEHYIQTEFIPIMDDEEPENYQYSIKDFFIRDTVKILATDPGYKQKDYVLRRRDVFTFFNEIPDSVNVLATYHGKPVLIESTIGDGRIILCSTPHLFSNIYLLQAGNLPFLSYVMSRVPPNLIVWTEFYEVGRGLSKNPLRYILSQPGLKAALYTLLISLVLFVVFQIKRKQRAIPVKKPLTNDSLEFVQTIGNLYLETGENISIAQKRIQFFLDYVRSNLYLDTRKLDENFALNLSRKGKVDKEEAEKIVRLINYINSKEENITDELLLSLSSTLDSFYTKNQI